MMGNSMSIRQYFPTLSTITAVSTASGSVYFLLLTDNFLNTSIASIILLIHDLDIAPHAFIIGLLPIYIAFTIFGSAIVGIYLGRLVNFLSKRVSHHPFFQKLGLHEGSGMKKGW